MSSYLLINFRVILLKCLRILLLKHHFNNNNLEFVPRTRFELVQPYGCHPLKMVRLPISPPGLAILQIKIAPQSAICLILSGVPRERLELSRDNSQRLLRPQRLPISPPGLIFLLSV